MVQILTVPLYAPTWRRVPVTADKPACTDLYITFLYILLLIARCALGITSATVANNSVASESCKPTRRLLCSSSSRLKATYLHSKPEIRTQ